jgi:hypothetical protein
VHYDERPGKPGRFFFVQQLEAGMVIRRIGPGSLAKVMGTMYALWGFIFGAIIAIIATLGASIGAAASRSNDMPMWLAPMFGIGAVIFMPIFYGVIGAIFGALSAAIYNLVAGMVGGLSLDVE